MSKSFSAKKSNGSDSFEDDSPYRRNLGSNKDKYQDDDDWEDFEYWDDEDDYDSDEDDTIH